MTVELIFLNMGIQSCVGRKLLATSDQCIDKVYIDGPCGFINNFIFINRTKRTSAYAVWSGSGISKLKCLQYDWARKFQGYKKCSAKSSSINLLISN